MVAKGRLTAQPATMMIQPTAYPAGITRSLAASGHTGATSAAPKPSRVAGATAGATSRFVITATGVSWPAISTSTGVTAT